MVGSIKNGLYYTFTNPRKYIFNSCITVFAVILLCINIINGNTTGVFSASFLLLFMILLVIPLDVYHKRNQ